MYIIKSKRWSISSMRSRHLWPRADHILTKHWPNRRQTHTQCLSSTPKPSKQFWNRSPNRSVLIVAHLPLPNVFISHIPGYSLSTLAWIASAHSPNLIHLHLFHLLMSNNKLLSYYSLFIDKVSRLVILHEEAEDGNAMPDLERPVQAVSKAVTNLVKVSHLNVSMILTIAKFNWLTIWNIERSAKRR